jgi:hypothetical protein
VDLTADQVGILNDYPVLVGGHDALRTDLVVDYRAYTRLTKLELQYDVVQYRLERLKASLAFMC